MSTNIKPVEIRQQKFEWSFYNKTNTIKGKKSLTMVYTTRYIPKTEVNISLFLNSSVRALIALSDTFLDH